jgi:transposase
MSSVIGIDVSKEKLDICLITNGKTKFKTCDNNQKGFQSLLEWIEFKCNLEKPKICMDATGTYMEEIAEFMQDKGFKVSIVNPMQIKSFSRSKLLRAKNDKSDSELIANFCLLNNPRIWIPQRKDLRQLREISRLINPSQKSLFA